jgi:hypothetical protein
MCFRNIIVIIINAITITILLNFHRRHLTGNQSLGYDMKRIRYCYIK